MTDVVEEYSHGCRIVHEAREDTGLNHYEDPLGHVKPCENPDKARL